MNDRKIKGGVYLVINPAMERPALLHQLNAALRGGLTAVQIWNNWLPDANKGDYINKVAELCNSYNVPLLVNGDWGLLLSHPELDGVHFDQIPENYVEIQNTVKRRFLAGITCSGDLNAVRWAHANKLDYVSFCAMFPSSSAGSCDIVMPQTVRLAHTLTNLPLFVSGGITPDNIPQLQQRTPFNGVAVISGIMSADDPAQKVKLYHKALNSRNKP
ncbi:thiamine phosphate synthase [Mucilaginibacter roseus]|uniref:Thiamine phosphate synthase n=1 Tax=Mucilaginibacter roseus TaxID=1528868 RepID=A0ABS8U031_9SPHI|nr:thiamine phosphate synthase [Mucilaginibacter roseus]MCD8739289.1 thiamine phosphate synthase [Mucilaginibacter roseus]